MSGSDPTIVYVKKVLPGGEPCTKCRDIEQRLHADGLMEHVDEILVAREDDAASPGMVLADRNGVTRAPFFVIRQADGSERTVESYLAFKRWISTSGFSTNDSTAGDLADAVDRHPDLAFI